MMDRLEDEASCHEGCCTSTKVTEPGGGRATDYVWSLVDLPLPYLADEDLEWAKAKFEEWQSVYLEETGYDRFSELLKYCQENDEPIIVVKWSDGNLYRWDGFHRTVCSTILGKPTIKAIFGTLKNK